MGQLNTIRVPVESAYVFCRGAMFCGVEAATDFDLRGKVEDAQVRDPETGLRVWTVTVIDMDQVQLPGDEDDGAGWRRSPETKVKVLSAHRPVPPRPSATGYGALVEFEGLTLTPWTDQSRCTGPERGKPHRCRARLTFSLKATGMREFSGGASTTS